MSALTDAEDAYTAALTHAVHANIAALNAQYRLTGTRLILEAIRDADLVAIATSIPVGAM